VLLFANNNNISKHKSTIYETAHRFLWTVLTETVMAIRSVLVAHVFSCEIRRDFTHKPQNTRWDLYTHVPPQKAVYSTDVCAVQ
jgi:hypothetical protein